MSLNLYQLRAGKDVVCEVTADYPLLFTIRPKLNKTWLRQVLIGALRQYFVRRGSRAENEVVRT